jgi:hypothetical protein
VFLELFPSSSRAQRHWKVAGKKGKIYIYRRHSAGGGIRQPSAVISALVVPYVNRQYCVHLCWRSAKATHQHWYLSWRAIKPTASTLVWISLVGTQFDSTTHSHTHTHSLPTLATATSSCNRPCPCHRRSWASPARRRLSCRRKTVDPLYNLQFLERRWAGSLPSHGEQLCGVEP